MNSTTYCHCKNLKFLLLASVGVFLASAFLFWSVALAAEETQIEAAIKDLSVATGQSISSEEQARTFCNQEQNLDVCADIGKKHALYEAEELKKVDNFLSEIKGKILDDIKNCSDEECLGRVASELAKKLQAKNSTLATDFKLTALVVAEKQGVIQASKEAGVNFKDCESLNPDTAPVDLLRKCARLAKDARVQRYIPEERRASAEQFGDTTIKLREALTAGKYQCGDGTLEGCGNFCLKSSAQTQEAGIPEVCRKIATEVFGAEGVKELERAHQQVGQVKDYYSKKFVLTLPNGKELAGEGQIRNACDQAFATRNIEIARACGNFAVKNGFAAQADVDRGLKIVETFTQSAPDVKFEQCITAPESCREFIPEEERGRFDAGSKIFEIMRTEIGFDPSQCERGAEDQTIGAKCFEGSKKALAKIESLGLAKQSREAGFIIEDIKRHVAEGENMIQRKDEFQQVFSRKGGPGGCRSEKECFAYCSDFANGPECIAFGAKQGITGFRGQEAVDKFQEYNQNLQFPGQGPYPGFRPPGQGGFPPGQIPGFTQPGPGFGQPGPSPECFAAIQSGDFVKAKAVCDTHTDNFPIRSIQVCPASPYVECPAGQYHESFRNNDGCWIDGPCRPAPTYSYSPYPTATGGTGDAYSCFYPNATKNGASTGYTVWCEKDYFNCHEGSPTGPSISLDGLSLGAPSSCEGGYQGQSCNNNGFCDSNETPASCPADCSGATSSPYPTYSSGSSSCSSSLTSLLGTGCHQMYSDSSGKQVYCDGPMTKSAKEGDTATTAGCSGGGSTYTPYPTTTSTSASCPTGSHTMGSYCMSDSQSDKCGPLNSTSTGSFGSCSSYTTTSSYSPPPSCPSGQWWDYTRNSCQTSNGTTTSYSPYPTTTSTTGGCPTGSHTMGSYCMSDSQSDKCGPLNSTSTGSFGSCSGYTTTYTYSPYPTTSTSATSCGTGYYWDLSTNSCKPTSPSDTVSPTISYTPYPTTTYTPPPVCTSTQYWNGSSCVENPPASTYTPPPYTPPPTCSSGQYWDGSACVTNPTPPPTSMLSGHQLAVANTIMSCSSSGGQWDSGRSTCVAKNSGFFASVLKAFSRFLIGR